MTKQQILEALEGLKELTNDHGKREIGAIKAGVELLEEPFKQSFVGMDPGFDPEPIPDARSGAQPASEVFHAHNTAKKKKGGKK